MRWLIMVVVAALMVTATAASTGDHYRVLILGPLASRSLHHLCSALAEALGDAGHDVTYVTSFKVENQSKYVRLISTRRTVMLFVGNYKGILSNQDCTCSKLIKRGGKGKLDSRFSS